MAKNVYFKHGTQAQFDALDTKDPNTLYWLTDTQRLYNGNKLFGDGFAVSAIMPADGSIEVGGNGAARTIGVKISTESDNRLSMNTDGLYDPPAIESVKVNGTALEPDASGAVNVDIPVTSIKVNGNTQTPISRAVYISIPVTSVKANGAVLTPDANHAVDVMIPVLGVQVDGIDLAPDANTKKVNLLCNTAYNASNNKIATMTDVSGAALAWGSF